MRKQKPADFVAWKKNNTGSANLTDIRTREVQYSLILI